MENSIVKYRAWDEDNQKMGFWESDDIDNSFWDKVRTQGHIPMQYIGKKDKNGVEIYKGDILTRPGWVVEGYGPNFTEAKWVKTRILLEVIFDSPSFSYKCLNDPEWNEWSGPSSSEEIIGNKFENPELLRKKNV